MTLPRPSDDIAARRAQAIGSPTRRALLAELRRSPTPLTVRRLAERTGLHANAVRQHLAVLGDAGLILESTAHAGTVGRPATVYRPADGTDNPFERLAALLAAVAEGADPSVVGAAEGARLAAPIAGEDPATAVAHAAAASGFAVRVERRADGAHVVLDGCPFAEFAGPVVCRLHRAVADGAAARAGGSVARFQVVDPAVAPCEIVIAPPEGASS